VRQPGPAFGDLIGGMRIAGGIAAALFHRERSGRATVVDNSLLQTAMWATGASLLGASVNGEYEPRNPDRRDVPNPVVNTYRTGDGRYLALVMLQSDRYWDEFVTKSGYPELAKDPRFCSAQARAENRYQCVDALGAMFAARTMEQWRAILADVEGVWAPVLRPNEVLTDRQVRSNDYLREITLDEGNDVHRLDRSQRHGGWLDQCTHLKSHFIRDPVQRGSADDQFVGQSAVPSATHSDFEAVRAHVLTARAADDALAAAEHGVPSDAGSDPGRVDAGPTLSTTPLHSWPRRSGNVAVSSASLC
jgi:hypothetical protein